MSSGNTLDCTKVRKIGTSASSSRWSAHWMATFRIWMGSSRRFYRRKNESWEQEGRATVCPSPVRITLWAHLAIIRVQGGAGLTEEGSICRHVGKAGDDFIEVPGVWDRES